MPNFDNHTDVMELVTASQTADFDRREKSRESHIFIDKEDGQWEPELFQANSGKPRYTFDQTSPIIDQIAGELEQANFASKVKPAGGDASKETALVFDGIIRNIETLSNASRIYNQAARSMITGGLDGWRIVQEFIDGDSFDQDLLIKPIPNFLDRVWFDLGSEEQDRSDAKWGTVLQTFTPDAFKEKWPDANPASVSQGNITNAYWYKPELVIVGEFYYIKEVERTLFLMSNGAVYEDDEEFEKIRDELEALQITVVNERKRKKNVVWVRKYTANDWLDKPQKTVFSWIPLIPTMGNFKVFENKVLYRGEVQKLMDAQRVLNYAKSREIEEGALAPREKLVMTEEQGQGHEEELATMNTNSEPVQYYTHVPNVPPPYKMGGAQINPGLQVISQSMEMMIGKTANMHAASMGANPGLQSGIAIKQLQDKGDTGTIKYFSAQEVAICHTARILIDAIPAAYEGQRTVRVLKEDDSFDMTKLNEQVIDQQTGEVVTLNDLTKGTYDVTCSSGASFQNRQQETVAALLEMGQVDPTIIQMASDIMLKNVTAPGMDLVAERKRAQLFQQGLIPQDQLTEEEQQQQQQQQQSQQEQQDPNMLIGQAELIKAQNEEKKTGIDVQVKSAQLKLDERRLQLDENRLLLEAEKAQDKTDIDIAKQKEIQTQNDFEQIMQRQQAQQKHINDAIANLKVLREAMGVDVFSGPHTQEAFINQAVEVTDLQEQAGVDTSVGEDVTGTNDDNLTI